ncbi:hypothetical protein RF11_13679 [Thelohanellus kitauei]|uniref:Uncharacterized protein n=1 Tax=Thelohanellus kitauei TaxID=669202 RepID=A0A0C2M5A3_THEKT|nr:hypothetical protein RF11_13679 [Thelohanellus kitauei]
MKIDILYRNLSDGTVIKEFDIALSVGPNVYPFTTYRFFLTELHDDIHFQLSDYFKIARVYIEFRANRSQAVQHLRSLYPLLSVGKNRTYSVSFNDGTDVSRAVVMNLKVYNISNNPTYNLLYELELSGYRISCTYSETIRHKHPTIFLQQTWKVGSELTQKIRIDFVIKDVFYGVKERTSIEVEDLVDEKRIEDASSYQMIVPAYYDHAHVPGNKCIRHTPTYYVVVHDQKHIIKSSEHKSVIP